MGERDFRYEMPDGAILEAFQLHEGTRYQEELWPEWMSSRYLMTKEGPDGKTTHWLNISDVETEVPEYGWIVKGGDGIIRAVDYSVMEEATKVVKEEVRVPDEAKPMSDAALVLASKLSKKSIDECRQEDLMNVEQANRNRQAIIDSLDPAEADKRGLRQSVTIDLEGKPMEQVYDELHEAFKPDPVLNPDDYPVVIDHEAGTVEFKDRRKVNYPGHAAFVDEMREVYRLFMEGEQDTAVGKMKRELASRTSWCSCAPGMCDGERDQWECRQNSLLARQ